ncbi:MAG TPA: diaminopimelate decarboxylase, partial [Bacteroidetes bacterium]|nr:diaminopimelate decarboxylase [Bacteroidota bacterium]
GDFFARARDLPPVQRGDILAVLSAGAYGFSISSNYNARPRPAELLISGEGVQVVREREAIEAIWS